MKEPEKRS